MQTVIIIALFLLALAYLGWRGYRSVARRNEAGCGKGCGCATDQATIKVVKARQ